MVKRFFCIFCFLFIATLLSSTASAIEYGGLGGLPAYPDPNNPRTKSIFVYTLPPGETKQDGVNVVNNSDETKQVEIYATDSEIASGGSFACTQKIDPKNRVGGWIKLNKTELSLAPLSSKIVDFTITTPDTVDVGEHNGCIVIQEKSEQADTPRNGVQLSFRSALRIAITIPGDIVKDIEFNNLVIKQQPSKYILSAYLFNKGNVSVDTDVQILVKSWLFNKTMYQNGGIYPLLTQKDAIELNYEYLKPFWGGIFQVEGSAEYNSDINAQLGTTTKFDTKKDSPKKILIVLPSLWAALIEFLLVVILLLILRRLIQHFRMRKVISKSWESYIVKSGDTINKLAKQRETSWKTIAKINKLRPPYEIITGNTIKLPMRKKH